MFDTWQHRLRAAAVAARERDPLAPGLSRGAATDLLGCPIRSCWTPWSTAAGLESAGGQIWLPGHRHDLGPAEAAVAELEIV